jgi:translation initiation factor IF-3
MDFSKERFKDKRREKELRKKQVSDALMPIGNSYAWKL